MVKIALNRPTATSRNEISYGKYTFTYDAELQPIAIEVPSDIAEVLLEMTGRVSSCCGKIPKPLFKEVN